MTIKTYKDELYTIILDEGTPADRYYYYNDASVSVSVFDGAPIVKDFRRTEDARLFFEKVVRYALFNREDWDEWCALFE